MGQINQDLADAIIRHDVDLLGLEYHERKVIDKALARLQKEIVARVSTGPVSDETKATDFRRAHLGKVAQFVDGLIDKTYTKVAKDWDKTLAKLTAVESEGFTTINNAAIGVSLMNPITNRAHLKSIADSTIVEGLPLKNHWENQSKSYKDKFQSTMTAGLLAQEDKAALTNRLIGTPQRDTDGRAIRNAPRVGGIGATTRRTAEALVRTSFQSVINNTRNAIYEQNADVIRSVVASAVFDNRTTEICIARSGGKWDPITGEPMIDSKVQISFPGPPPWHIQCRTTLTPELKDIDTLLAESGLSRGKTAKLKALPPGQRRRFDGRPAQDLKYDSWLERQSFDEQDKILGPTKADLWRSGKLSLSQLIDASGKRRTLAQLAAITKLRAPHIASKTAPSISAYVLEQANIGKSKDEIALGIQQNFPSSVVSNDPKKAKAHAAWYINKFKKEGKLKVAATVTAKPIDLNLDLGPAPVAPVVAAKPIPYFQQSEDFLTSLFDENVFNKYSKLLDHLDSQFSDKSAQWVDSLLSNQIAPAAGSNEGGLYEKNGKQYYVKFYKNPAQGYSEVIANKIYKTLGVEVPESTIMQTGIGNTVFISKYYDNVAGTVGTTGLDGNDARDILNGFVADVLTANWDAVGTGLDNVVKLKNGKIARIDQGGTFTFRAQGELKPASALPKIDEWQTLVTKNPYYKKVFEKAGIADADALGDIAIEQLDKVIGLVDNIFQENVGEDDIEFTWLDFLSDATKSLPKGKIRDEALAEAASMLGSRFNALISKRIELVAAKLKKESLPASAISSPVKPADLPWETPPPPPPKKLVAVPATPTPPPPPASKSDTLTAQVKKTYTYKDLPNAHGWEINIVNKLNEDPNISNKDLFAHLKEKSYNNMTAGEIKNTKLKYAHLISTPEVNVPKTIGEYVLAQAKIGYSKEEIAAGVMSNYPSSKVANDFKKAKNNVSWYLNKYKKEGALDATAGKAKPGFKPSAPVAPTIPAQTAKPVDLNDATPLLKKTTPAPSKTEQEKGLKNEDDTVHFIVELGKTGMFVGDIAEQATLALKKEVKLSQVLNAKKKYPDLFKTYVDDASIDDDEYVPPPQIPKSLQTDTTYTKPKTGGVEFGIMTGPAPGARIPSLPKLHEIKIEPTKPKAPPVTKEQAIGKFKYQHAEENSASDVAFKKMATTALSFVSPDILNFSDDIIFTHTPSDFGDGRNGHGDYKFDGQTTTIKIANVSTEKEALQVFFHEFAHHLDKSHGGYEAPDHAAPGQSSVGKGSKLSKDISYEGTEARKKARTEWVTTARDVVAKMKMAGVPIDRVLNLNYTGDQAKGLYEQAGLAQVKLPSNYSIANPDEWVAEFAAKYAMQEYAKANNDPTGPALLEWEALERRYPETATYVIGMVKGNYLNTQRDEGQRIPIRRVQVSDRDVLTIPFDKLTKEERVQAGVLGRYAEFTAIEYNQKSLDKLGRAVISTPHRDKEVRKPLVNELKKRIEEYTDLTVDDLRSFLSNTEDIRVNDLQYDVDTLLDMTLRNANDAWNRNSTTTAMSALMQKTVNERYLGFQGNYVVDRYAAGKATGTQTSTSRKIDSILKNPKYKRIAELITDVHYDATQKWLEDNDITHVPVFRNYVPNSATGTPADNDMRAAELQPLSSYAMSSGAAAPFGPISTVATIPRERIFSMPNIGGMGVPGEHEVVVLGGKLNTYEIKKSKVYDQNMEDHIQGTKFFKSV